MFAKIKRCWHRVMDPEAPWNRPWVTISIRQKLIIGFSLILFVLLFSTAVSLLELRDIRQFNRRLTQLDFPSLMNSQTISRDVYASMMALQSWMDTKDQNYQAERQALWVGLNNIIKENNQLSLRWDILEEQLAWRRIKAMLLLLQKIQTEAQSVSENTVSLDFITSHPILYWNHMSRHLVHMISVDQKQHEGKPSAVGTLLSAIQRNDQQALMSLQQYLAAGNATYLTSFNASLEETKKAIAHLSSLSKSLILQHQVLLNRYLLMRDQFIMVADRLIKLRKSNYWSASRYLLVGQAEPITNSLMNILVGVKNDVGQRYGGLQTSQYFNLLSDTHALSNDILRLQWFEWAMLGAGILLGLFMVIMIAKVILRRLNRAIRVAGYIAGGRRDLDITVESTKDEAGQLLNALHYMQASIKKAEKTLEARK